MYTEDCLLENDARMLPEYWGQWFVPIGEGDMKETDLAIFYHMGKSFMGMKLLEEFSNSNLVEAVRLLNSPQLWLMDFVRQTEGMEMPESRAAARALIADIGGLFGELRAKLPDARDAVVEAATIRRFNAGLKTFEDAFVRESKQLDVFTVTPKGDRSTRILIESAEKKFPANLVKVMPEKTISDLQEAGRCLAFELPTACAFHICRATEALMIAYYEALTSHPWPSHMRPIWQVYVDQLRVEGAPSTVTNRLGELREDRNSYAHPDVTVPLDEAPIVYDLCTGVMFYMAKEIEKIEAAKAAAPNPSTPT